MGDLLLAGDQLMEKHSLNGSDNLVSFTTGKDVVVTLEADASPRNRDSSRVQSTMLSDYKWDGSHLRPHSDRLLSVSGNFLSYRLSHDSSVEAVRVFERQTRIRALIKGFRDAIVDLAWSRSTNMLAVLDASSNLYVYHVTDTCGIEKHLNLRWEDEDGSELLKGVNLENLDAQEEEKENPSSRNSTTGAPGGGPAYSRPRLIWCPYIPEDDDEPSEHLNMLAITKGRSLHVINVSLLHAGVAKAEYVDLAAAREIEGAVLTETLEHPITTLSMSPDATAMAVGDTSGQVSFFIIEPTSLKFAHHWNPIVMDRPIKDLFFLDNYDQGESFWRFCLAVDEDGRELYLFECENWTCVGKLRIESSMKLGKFMVQVDPTARYALLVDIDGANLFCISLDYSTPDGLSFAGITQIGFYHPLVAVAAFEVKDVEPPTSDFSFDDDDTHSNVDKAETIISLISITPRSVLHVDVTVEKPEKKEQSLLSELASPRAVVNSGNTAAPTESSHSNPVEILPAHLPHETGRGSSARLGGYDPMNVSASSNVDLSTVMKMFEDLNVQMDKLTHRVERADEERKAAATNESIVKMLQQFKEEFSLREDRLLANISDLIETSRAETVAVVRNALNENSLAVENSIQGNHKISTEYVMKVVSERTKEALAAMVIPSIDRVCTQLFKQLNDQFKEGLGQFMQQMRVQQAAMIASTVASTPLPSGAAAMPTDRAALLHLIKTRQVQLAFETVLNQADESSLQFVCRQIDPDELFGNVSGGDGGLSQPVLLSLLQQLSYKLDSDTDLKFRYIEHLLEALQPYDDSISVHVPKVVSVITDALNEFQLRTPNANLKRQARVITQLVRNLRQ